MYYNANENSKNDYYHAYKEELKELERKDREATIQKIIMYILFFISFILFIAAIFYLYKYFSPNITEDRTTLSSFVIKEDLSPKSTMVPKKELEINSEDITTIVKMVMLEMELKKDIPSDNKKDDYSGLK